MNTHDYDRFAVAYSELDISDTYYLAFRDLPSLLQRYTKGMRALDYGCGTGRSTRFLRTQGFESTGVDISAAMLQQAKVKDPKGDYTLIESGCLPFEDETFDLVFSSFVFLEVSSRDEIEHILSEMKRVLKRTGCIVFVTSPANAYEGNWVSFSYDFPENKRTVTSGETVKLLIRGTGVVLYDYCWTEDDYKAMFSSVGLKLRELHKPLGRDDDPFEWLDEKSSPAMCVYVLGKSNRRSRRRTT